VRHLAACVHYERRTVDVLSSSLATIIRVWCDIDAPNSDVIVFEAALSDCEACQATRSKALHDVRPSTTTK
jgi:hypothetical protein